MFAQAFSKGLHTLSLRVNLSIETDGQTDNQRTGFRFINQVLYRFPRLCFIARDVQRRIGRGQKLCGVTDCHANSGLTNIQSE